MFVKGLVFVIEVLGAGIIAYVAMLFTEPKKQRVAEYNDLLKDFSGALSQAHDLAIRYWSCDGQVNDLEGFLLSAKTECNRLASVLNKKQCKFYDFEAIAQKSFSYFQIITGDGFQEQARKADAQKLDEANKVLRELKDFIDSSKVSYTIKILLFYPFNKVFGGINGGMIKVRIIHY